MRSVIHLTNIYTTSIGFNKYILLIKIHVKEIQIQNNLSNRVTCSQPNISFVDSNNVCALKWWVFSSNIFMWKVKRVNAISWSGQGESVENVGSDIWPVFIKSFSATWNVSSQKIRCQKWVWVGVEPFERRVSADEFLAKWKKTFIKDGGTER